MKIDDQVKILSDGANFPCGDEEFKEKLKLSVKNKKPLCVKYGADPSAADIHLGHCVPIFKLKQFQDFGHQVIFIIGDFTARIGDPSGKTKTRPTLTTQQVKDNAKTYQNQIFKILNPDQTKIVFNNDWFEKMQFSKVIDIAARYNVARMLERNDFSDRFKNQESITILEFFYPLIQAYDSVYLKNDIELGGTDQEFNFLLARDLMKSYELDPQIVMTMPLLVGTDGVKKMSKSYDNYIGIDENPIDIYGKVMSVSDETLFHYNELFLCLNKEMCVSKELLQTYPYQAKHDFAFQITMKFQGEKEAVKARDHFKQVHQNRLVPEEIEEYLLSQSDMSDMDIVRFVQNSGLVSSQSEGRRLLSQNAIKIDGKKVSLETPLSVQDGSVLQVGKRRFKKIRIQKK